MPAAWICPHGSIESIDRRPQPAAAAAHASRPRPYGYETRTRFDQTPKSIEWGRCAAVAGGGRRLNRSSLEEGRGGAHCRLGLQGRGVSINQSINAHPFTKPLGCCRRAASGKAWALGSFAPDSNDDERRRRGGARAAPWLPSRRSPWACLDRSSLLNQFNHALRSSAPAARFCVCGLGRSGSIAVRRSRRPRPPLLGLGACVLLSVGVVGAIDRSSRDPAGSWSAASMTSILLRFDVLARAFVVLPTSRGAGGDRLAPNPASMGAFPFERWGPQGSIGGRG